jgi:hypothetical protein
MPEVLQNNPLIIVVIVLVLVLLIAIPVLIRRRRAGADEVLPPPELGQQIDYTSLPYEEPTGLGDRFRRLSIGAKLLLFLVPLVLIVAIVIGVMSLQPTPEDITTQVTPPASQIKIVQADVSGEGKILVRADTDLPNGAVVSALLKENDQDFAWFDPESGSAQASDGKVQLTLTKLKDGPTPNQDQQYMVVLSAAVGSQTISSEPTQIQVPAPLRASFYGLVVAAPTAAPTVAPTAAPAPSARPAATPAPPTPTATQEISLTATVFNGGNIRPRAQVEPCPNCPQLHANEIVQLLEKTADSRWYRVIAPEGTGWVSVTLLRIDGEVARQVPIEGQRTPPTPAPGGEPGATPTGLTATVFNGGNIRERPVGGRPLGQLRAGQTVELLEKTADGVWYRVIAPEATGWVHVSLLRIDAEVAKQVPIVQ